MNVSASEFPSSDHIIEALERIRPFVHRTPVLTSTYFNDLLASSVFFKCENFQKVGAFKYRGATNAVLQLSEAEKKSGVATHSSGNHAQALALASRVQGIKAFIVMPKNAPRVKVEAVEEYGAEITFCEPTLQARESTLAQVVEKTGATIIHPYDNDQIICGQASATMEFLEQVPDLDVILAPVGGGGLLSGTCLATHYFGTHVKVIAAEPSGADDAFRSFNEGKLYPSVHPKTIADGLLTSLSDRTFRIIRTFVDKIITVSDDEIINSMKEVWQRMKIIIEPSSAVVIAAMKKKSSLFRNKKVGAIISGGNVDLDALPF